MLNDETIRGIVSATLAAGSPLSLAMKLEADLFNAKFAHEGRLRRANRHSEVLSMVTKCGGKVADAAQRLELTTRAVYLHLEAPQKVKATG